MEADSALYVLDMRVNSDSQFYAIEKLGELYGGGSGVGGCNLATRQLLARTSMAAEEMAMTPKPGKRKRRKTEAQRLMKEAIRVHSLFIRKRDGYRCVLCGATSNIQNGHLIKRGKKATLFSDLNCHAICSGCNYKDNFFHDTYVNWFVTKYGVEPYQDLVKQAAVPKQWKPYELQEIIDRCKQ